MAEEWTTVGRIDLGQSAEIASGLFPGKQQRVVTREAVCRESPAHEMQKQI